jgi:hypothetical protein
MGDARPATSGNDGPLACRAERKLGRAAAALSAAARYSMVSQGESAPNISNDGPLACRAERKLGLLAAALSDAALPAGRRPGGPRYWVVSRDGGAPDIGSERRLDLVVALWAACRPGGLRYWVAEEEPHE